MGVRGGTSMTRFVRNKSGLAVPVGMEDRLENTVRDVRSTYTPSAILGPDRKPMQKRDGKVITHTALDVKRRELSSYRDTLRTGIGKGTLLDFLINNGPELTYTNSDGEEETVSLKDTDTRKTFAYLVSAAKEFAKVNSLDCYDGATDSLRISDNQLGRMAMVAEEYALDGLKGAVSANPVEYAKRGAMSIDAQLFDILTDEDELVKAGVYSKEDVEGPEKVIQMPSPEERGIRARGKGGKAAAFVGLALALVGCQEWEDWKWNRRHRPRKTRTHRTSNYRMNEWGERNMPLEASLAYAGGSDERDINGQTWDMSKGGVDLRIHGSVLNWYRSGGKFPNSNLILDIHYSNLTGDGTIPGVGDITSFTEEEMKFLMGLSQEFYFGDSDHPFAVSFLLGKEGTNVNADVDYAGIPVAIKTDRSGFAFYVIPKFTFNDHLSIEVPYGHVSLEGTEETPAGSTGLTGDRNRVGIHAVIKYTRDPKDEKFWLGPTRIGFDYRHDDLNLFDQKLYDFVISQDFMLRQPQEKSYLDMNTLLLFLEGRFRSGTKDFAGGSEDINTNMLRAGIRYHF
jgi:hypothetical protein